VGFEPTGFPNAYQDDNIIFQLTQLAGFARFYSFGYKLNYVVQFAAFIFSKHSIHVPLPFSYVDLTEGFNLRSPVPIWGHSSSIYYVII